MRETSAPDESTTGRHIAALDGVRGLAVVLVLLEHLFVRNPNPAGSWPVRFVALLFSSGWVGVDLFFVLSGFLITGILYDTQRGPRFFRNFYARRALRIFPLYYALLFVLIAVSTAQGYHWYLKGTLLYLTYLHTLWIGGVGYTTAPWVNINHLWSLAVEEQFYLVWPLLVFLLKTRRRIVVAALVGTACSIALRCWVYAAGVLHTYHYATYSWSPTRLDGLLVGAVLAMLIRSRWRAEVLRWAPLVFGTGAVLSLLVVSSARGMFPFYYPLLGIAGYPLFAVTFAALIGWALETGSVASRVCGVRFLRLFGRYSYGIYVYHYVVHQLLTERVYDGIAARTGSKLVPLVGAGLVTVAAAMAVAVVSFHFFESPILRLKRYFPSTGRRPTLRQDVEEANLEEAAGA